MPMRVGAKLEQARLPLDQTVRAGPNRQRHFGGRDPSEGILASDDRKLEVSEECGVRLPEDEHDGAWVGDLHLGDPSVVLGVPTAQAWVDDAFEGCDDIARIERAAVAEAQAFPETHFEFRRAHRFHGLGEVGDHL